MSDKPFWKSIRGVGIPGTHKPTWNDLVVGHIPSVNYESLEYTGPKEQLLPVQAPTCRRCGLRADPKWPNNWYCHFCLEEVTAPMRPGAMIPVKHVPKSGMLEPSLSDPKGEMICPKCATSRRPRADNQGFTCQCGTIYTVPGVRRVSPTNGF